MALLGKKAPQFTANALVNGTSKSISLEDYAGKYVVLFFYPKDDTGVCGSEVHAFHKRMGEFESRNAQLIAASVDDMDSHMAWASRGMADGGIQGLGYPILEDPSRNVAASYDVLAGDWTFNADGTVISDKDLLAFRGLYIIDPKGVVRHALINDIPLGRSVDECLRNLDAIKNLEENGEVCMVHSSK